MTLRRRLAPLFIAVVSGATGFAQFGQPSAPAAPASPNLPSTQSVQENMSLRFANGIVAVAEDKIITVADVMHEIGPLIPSLRDNSRTEKEFQERLEQMQDETIQNLIDRVLIVKEFRKDEKRQIPPQYVDNAMNDELTDRFEGDRSKFLAYLHSRGLTTRDYRKEKEEEIILSYMQGQQRKSQSIVSPVKIETYYVENKDRFYREDEIHLRLIQLTRTDGETDETLGQTANQILARVNAGEKFEDLAKEYSKDVKRSKGGDWGILKRSDFRKEFSDIAFDLKKGEVSKPLVLPEGVFLLYIEDRKYSGIQPIDEVRTDIERMLIQQMSRSSQERWLERLRRNGYVKHY
jgi:peptidyl-prolyl cis-trans isomerase SurA